MRLKSKDDYIYSQEAIDDLWTSKEKVRSELVKHRSGKRTNASIDSVGFTECYMIYPYKKHRHFSHESSSLFYVKKKDHTNHKYSLDFIEYRTILKCFIKHLYEYLVHGNVYRFTSDIGEIRIMKYKPKFMGWNLSKAIKKIVKLKNIPYEEAKLQVSEHREFLEERKNILLNGYKFKLKWFNKYTNVRNITFWYLTFTDTHKPTGIYIKTLKFYQKNITIFNKVLTHTRDKSRL